MIDDKKINRFLAGAMFCLGMALYEMIKDDKELLSDVGKNIDYLKQGEKINLNDITDGK